MLKKIQAQLTQKLHPKLIVFLAVLLATLLGLTVIRVWSAIGLRHKTNERAIPIVDFIKVSCGPAQEEIILPGNVRAWHEAPIYARTNGYIKNWYVDIGDHVNQGDLLAEIETPELDQQLHQAEANLQVVVANYDLAQVTALRWIGLLKTDSVSKQETDEKVDAEKALKASVVAARANRDRLTELVHFEQVVAPFSGTISLRTIDIGSLINEGSNPAAAKPLFRIVQKNPLRVYVRIPENDTSIITAKMRVNLQFAEHPGQSFPAKLLKTAEAIDPKTRTLLAQFITHNKQGLLLPGSYTEVHFNRPLSLKTIRLPVNTLLFRTEGLRVAILNQDNRITLRPITISRDFGKEVEVKSGLAPGERVVINPPDSLYDGEQVRLGVI